jgi:hypothetical protein
MVVAEHGRLAVAVVLGRGRIEDDIQRPAVGRSTAEISGPSPKQAKAPPLGFALYSDG